MVGEISVRLVGNGIKVLLSVGLDYYGKRVCFVFVTMPFTRGLSV